MKPFYLYKVTNLENGKLYIGVTKNFETRKKQHINSRKSQRSLLNKAILKYGVDKFLFEVICIGSEDYIYDLEVKAIISYNSNASIGHGYNISAGGKGGEGSSVNKRRDDKAIYVKGFWFPCRRTCLDKLNLSPSSLWGRMKLGDAGEERWLRPTSTLDKPVYVAGIWFRDLHLASYLLKVQKEILNSRIRIGQIEQKVDNPGRRKQEIYVEGVIYSSLNDAAENSKYTRKMLYRRLKNDPENFYLTKNSEEK